jgi:hypothetical protein
MMATFKNKTTFGIVLLVLGVFVSLGPVSAEHTTSIEAIHFPNDYPYLHVRVIRDHLIIPMSHEPDRFGARLYVDGKTRMYRYINLDIYNSHGKNVYHDRVCAWRLCGTVVFESFFGVKGKYTMVFSYEGNSKDGYPPANKTVPMELK